MPSPDPHPPLPSLPLHQAHALLSSFTAFLTVAVHTVLFYRRLYPPATFLSARAYNLPVHQSRHPKVCAWVRAAVDAVAAQLAGGGVSRVAVVIHAPLTTTTPSPAAAGVGSEGSDEESGRVRPGAVLERWMFDVSRFPSWPGGAESLRSFDAAAGRSRQGEEDLDEDPAAVPAGAAAAGGGGGDGGTGAGERGGNAVNWADVDEQFRAVVGRMAHAGESMAPLPDGCTFTVAVELKEEGQAPIGVSTQS